MDDADETTAESGNIHAGDFSYKTLQNTARRYHGQNQDREILTTKYAEYAKREKAKTDLTTKNTENTKRSGKYKPLMGADGKNLMEKIFAYFAWFVVENLSVPRIRR
jgi:hypothetical protein